MSTDPDDFVPEHIARLTHHYYNLIHVKEYWTSIGAPTPKWIDEELIRADKEIQELLDREKQQGGFLHKRGERNETR